MFENLNNYINDKVKDKEKFIIDLFNVISFSNNKKNNDEMISNFFGGGCSQMKDCYNLIAKYVGKSKDEIEKVLLNFEWKSVCSTFNYEGDMLFLLLNEANYLKNKYEEVIDANDGKKTISAILSGYSGLDNFTEIRKKIFNYAFFDKENNKIKNLEHFFTRFVFMDKGLGEMFFTNYSEFGGMKCHYSISKGKFDKICKSYGINKEKLGNLFYEDFLKENYFFEKKLYSTAFSNDDFAIRFFKESLSLFPNEQMLESFMIKEGAYKGAAHRFYSSGMLINLFYDNADLITEKALLSFIDEMKNQSKLIPYGSYIELFNALKEIIEIRKNDFSQGLIDNFHNNFKEFFCEDDFITECDPKAVFIIKLNMATFIKQFNLNDLIPKEQLGLVDSIFSKMQEVEGLGIIGVSNIMEKNSDGNIKIITFTLDSEKSKDFLKKEIKNILREYINLQRKMNNRDFLPESYSNLRIFKSDMEEITKVMKDKLLLEENLLECTTKKLKI